MTGLSNSTYETVSLAVKRLGSATSSCCALFLPPVNVVQLLEAGNRQPDSRPPLSNAYTREENSEVARQVAYFRFIKLDCRTTVTICSSGMKSVFLQIREYSPWFAAVSL